ncbi:hypothetical protein DFH08DRAFT_815755 [Mycena albidolilacea]|uniref:WAP domain-containing protein n=1 Tax=Mycena albidolilacea TaxID=1033008 RepID=A0AAD6ZLN7_9AGAR|nr:hypothetical protein DFH08DRAFT_815755 [Mycena albidolilacea]
MLFPLRLVLVVGLFLFLGISCHSTNSPPAKRLTLLKPRKVSNSLMRQTVIRGLLVSRQHCESEVRCQEGGCCDTDENCCEATIVPSPTTGMKDVAPPGRTARDHPMMNATPVMSPVPMKTSAVLLAKLAVARDSDGNPTCGSQPIQTLTVTTGTPNQGNQNVTIDLASEAGITWSGDWVTVGSCSSSGNGTAAYLSLSGANTRYAVSIDGQETSFTSPSTQNGSGCTITWSQTDLRSGSHNLTIKASGVTDLQRRGGAAAAEWAFNIFDLILTAAGSGIFGDAASSNAVSWPLFIFPALTRDQFVSSTDHGGKKISAVKRLEHHVMILADGANRMGGQKSQVQNLVWRHQPKSQHDIPRVMVEVPLCSRDVKPGSHAPGEHRAVGVSDPPRTAVIQRRVTGHRERWGVDDAVQSDSLRNVLILLRRRGIPWPTELIGTG